MRRFLKITGIVLIILIVLVVLFPFLFKDKIKTLVQQEIDNRIDAHVYFGDFDLTLIHNFPNLTITLDDFGVVGKGMFEGDTLADIHRLNVVLDIMSVIGGGKIEIKKFLLDEPRIYAIIMPNGKANWDIYKQDTTVSDTGVIDTTSSSFSMALREYGVNHAALRYDDRLGKMYAEIKDLTHSGKGDFNDDQFMFRTRTEAKSISFKMDGVSYARNIALDARVDMDMDMAKNIYTFRDNRVAINDLHIAFSGFVQPAGDDLRMDLKYEALQTEFKNILSLIPGIFTESFNDISTAGTLALNGYARGTYNDSRLPSFGMNLKVENASFKYPDLPSEVRNIGLDVQVSNNTGVINETNIDLHHFHAELGANPVDAKAIIHGLDPADIDANIIARINLAEMMSLFPMEGTELKGVLDLKAHAKGKYSDKSMPVIDAIMSLSDGYLKSADFPSALEKLSFNASMISDGSLPNSALKVTGFHSEIDKEPIDLNLEVNHFEDPAFHLVMKGSLDLEKLTKIYPVEGSQIAGKILMSLDTKGRQSDVEAQRWFNIPTSGSMEIADLKYKSEDMPQGLTISKASFGFDPRQINIHSYTGTVGSSHINLSGNFTNYLGYVLTDNQALGGSMLLNSPKFNVNEWMTDEPETASQSPSEETPMTPFEVPGNIAFVLHSNITEVLYDNLVLTNLSGLVTIKDKSVLLDGINFSTLDGTIGMSAVYDAKNIAQPAFEMAMTVSGMNIRKSYEAFNTVQSLAPAAKFVDGKFSSNLHMSSKLGMDMMPLYNTFNGAGVMVIADGVASGMPILDKLGEAAKFASIKEVRMKDTKITFSIRNGRIYYDPFDVTAGTTKLNIAGSNGFDKSIDYLVKADMPTGAAGKAANAAAASITGGNNLVGSRIKMDVHLGGTFDHPKILGVGGESGNSVQDQVKDAVKDKVDELKTRATDEAERLKREAEDRARQEATRLQKEAQDRAMQEAERLKKEGADRARQESERLKKEADARARQEADKLKQAAEQKAKDDAAKKAKEEAEKLKNKIKFPK